MRGTREWKNKGKNGEELSSATRRSVVWCLGSDVKRRLHDKQVARAAAVLLCGVMVAAGGRCQSSPRKGRCAAPLASPWLQTCLWGSPVEVGFGPILLLPPRLCDHRLSPLRAGPGPSHFLIRARCPFKQVVGFLSFLLQKFGASGPAKIRSCSLPEIRDLNIAQPSEMK